MKEEIQRIERNREPQTDKLLGSFPISNGVNPVRNLRLFIPIFWVRLWQGKKRGVKKLRLLLVLGTIYFHSFLSHGWAEEDASLLKEVTQTETVYLREKGEIQITTSLGFTIGEKENLLTFPFAIEYGLSDVWETELEWD